MSTQPFEPPAPSPSPGEERLERYLDGLLSPEERAAFEAEAAADPAVRAQVDAHRRMQVMLMDYASEPQAPARPLKFDDAPPVAPAPKNRRWIKVAAIAAAVGISVCAAIVYVASRPTLNTINGLTSEDYQRRHRQLILDEYASQVASGFKPKEVCTTDAQFVEWTTRSLKHGLKPVHGAVPAGTPEPVLAGWSRSTTFSSYTGLLLASVDGKPVMVVMDEAPPERMVPKEDASNAPRLFRRNVNGVWLIEVTPLDHPSVINRIEAAS